MSILLNLRDLSSRPPAVMRPALADPFGRSGLGASSEGGASYARFSEDDGGGPMMAHR